MKVALLMSGQPRYVDDSRPFSFFKENVIDKYDVDVYCHGWFDRDSEYEKSPWSNNSHRLETNSKLTRVNPVPPNADTIILESYKPRQYKFESPRTFQFSEDAQNWLDSHFTGRHHEGFFSNVGYSCILSQLKSMQECMNLIDGNYDAYILSRYDITITNFISDISSLDFDYMHLQNIHDRFPDGIYIFGNKYLDWFKNLFNEVQTSKVYSKIPHPSTEQFKRTSFDINYGMKYIKPHPMRINILRK